MKKTLLIGLMSFKIALGQTYTVSVVKDINYQAGSSISSLTQIGNKAVFTANDNINGNEVWVTDGTASGTTLLKDIYAGTTGTVANSSGCGNFTKYTTSLVLFTGNNALGNSLWITDGSISNTMLLKQFGVAAVIGEFTEHNGKVYFQADNGINGSELWVTDGTASGTQLVKDINVGVDGSFPAYFCSHTDGYLYFMAASSINDFEMWRTDGTASGTTLVLDIIPGATGSYPSNFYSFNGFIYFAGYDLTNMLQLWKSDGTASGTNLFKVINPSGNSFPNKFNKIGSNLLFTAENSNNNSELWVTDGTASGTQLVKDINNNSGSSSNPSNFFKIGSLMYFNANDGSTGNELWVTDGTTNGTQLKFNINAGSASSNPNNLFYDGSNLFLSADSTGINDLMVTDLTITPHKYCKVNNGGSSLPSKIFKINSDLFVVGTNSLYGEELYKIVPVITYTNPIAVDDAFSVAQNTISIGDLSLNDTGGGSINSPTYTVTQPSVLTGSISLNPATGQYTFTPNSSFSGTASLSYTLCNNSGNCSSAALTFTVNSTIGINELIKNNTIKIYPNPVNDFIKLDTNVDGYKVLITNALGEIILDKIYNESIDVSLLKKGLYFIQVKNYSSKFIKE